MDGIWGNSLSCVHDHAEISYFNMDGKHFHAEICLEKRKLTIKDVCREKKCKWYLGSDMPTMIYTDSFSFQICKWERMKSDYKKNYYVLP